MHSQRCFLFVLLISLLVPVVGLPAYADEDYEDEAAEFYREGQEALSEGDFKDARRLFQAVSSDYEDSEVAGDALYWEAFANYRLGSKRNPQV